MHGILVVVFDNEAKADQGKAQLLQMDNDGTISTYGYAVIAKKKDGTVVLNQADAHGHLSFFAKSLIRGLSESDNPTSFWAAPRPSDSALNANRAENAINQMIEVLLPDRVAIVTEVEEEWPIVLDRRMESNGGVVFRWTVSEVQHALEI